MVIFVFLACLLFCSGVQLTEAGVLPEGCRQAIVGTTRSWDDSHVRLSLLEKRGSRWVLVQGPFAGRLGKNGSVWGLGLVEPGKGQMGKREGDAKSPAGVFLLGDAYGTVSPPQHKRTLVYHRIGERDLWVDDPQSPYYNQHLVLNHTPRTAWELKQQMRIHDYHHSLKLFIRHNSAETRGRPVPGAGSSIFFHIWRSDGRVPTAGCTSMAEADLRRMIAWVDPSLAPVYILLPASEYMKRREAWGLP